MESGKAALGVLAGIATGALIGVLFAPAKGSKTRRRILDKGQDYAEELKGKFDDLYQDVTNKYDSFIDEAKEIVNQK